MRERTRLEESIGRYRRLEAALNDNIELIEMGEAEAYLCGRIRPCFWRGK